MSTTTKTINVNPNASKTVTLPDYNEVVDINVLTTDLGNLVDGVNNADTAAVHKTGTETIAGDKTWSGKQYYNGNSYFQASIYTANSATSPIIYFRGTKQTSVCASLQAAGMAVDSDSAPYASGRLRFIQYSPNTDGTATTGKYEAYELPYVDVNITKANATYKILTTKTAPTFKTLSLASGENNFTVTNGSRIRLDIITGVAARIGTSLVCSNSNGAFYIKSDLGSSLGVTGSSGTLTVTSTGGTSTMYCTIYAGDIT